jgi:DNA-binding NarL/FixJ family response regulator
MSRPPKIDEPSALRVTELDVGGEKLLVISYPIEQPDLVARFGLTEAEACVAQLAIEGLSNAEIARRRGSSARTIANQVAAVLRKVGVASRRELAARYARGAFDD